jgi:DNA repair photolyase
MYPNSHGITTDIVRLDKSEIQALYDDGKIPKTGYMELMDLADKRPVYSVVDLCIFQLKKLLKPGNFVMITTKPDYFCVQQMMEKLSPWKDHILFRFTITSRSDTSLQHWEPHAPNFFERKLSLLYAYLEGWATSVSMEPFLDPDPVPLLLELEPYVTETLWIGKLNYHSLAFNSNDAVKAIARRLLSLPERIRTKLRMKDSFQEVCGASTPYITKDNLLEVDA